MSLAILLAVALLLAILLFSAMVTNTQHTAMLYSLVPEEVRSREGKGAVKGRQPRGHVAHSVWLHNSCHVHVQQGQSHLPQLAVLSSPSCPACTTPQVVLRMKNDDSYLSPRRAQAGTLAEMLLTLLDKVISGVLPDAGQVGLPMGVGYFLEEHWGRWGSKRCGYIASADGSIYAGECSRLMRHTMATMTWLP